MFLVGGCYIPAISAFQMSWAWQSRHHIFIRMSSPSAGSARAVSSALWHPRPRPPLGQILRDSSQLSASANFQKVNWKREPRRCGLVFTILPWSSQSPVRPEVWINDERNITFQVLCQKRKTSMILLILSRFHQKAVCGWNCQLHQLPRSYFNSGMCNHRFLPSKHISHLAETQRGRGGWQRRRGDRGRRVVGPNSNSHQTVQDDSHFEEKDNPSGDKGQKRGNYLQSGALFSKPTNRETVEKWWHGYEALEAHCTIHNLLFLRPSWAFLSLCPSSVAPSIPPSISVCWSSEGVGVFSLLLKGGHPKAKLLWAAGGPTLSPLVSSETEEIGDDGQRELKSVCALERSTSLLTPTSKQPERQKNRRAISTCDLYSIHRCFFFKEQVKVQQRPSWVPSVRCFTAVYERLLKEAIKSTIEY